MTLSRNTARPRREIGFTLVELLVVVSIIALLVAILLPSLRKAREQTKLVVCLSNTKNLGLATLTYSAEHGGTLPGPLHPAVYRDQTLQNYLDQAYSLSAAKAARDRQLTWILHTTLSQRGEAAKKNVADAVATCPVMLGIVPDKQFYDFITFTGRKGLFPTHYALNHYGNLTADQSSTGFTDNPRITKPPYYFGFSPPSGSSATVIAEAAKNLPKGVERINRASDEWMIADAWYRSIAGLPTLPQQAGPYQSGWSGEALPFFAPHFRRGNTSVPVDPAARKTLANQINANRKSDGKTATVFFDGHAAPVISKQLKIILPDGRPGPNTNIYGFPGTVNPQPNAAGYRFEWQ